jgi:hypothetical protein
VECFGRANKYSGSLPLVPRHLTGLKGLVAQPLGVAGISGKQDRSRLSVVRWAVLVEAGFGPTQPIPQTLTLVCSRLRSTCQLLLEERRGDHLLDGLETDWFGNEVIHAGRQTALAILDHR